MRFSPFKTSLSALVLGALLAGPAAAATCGNDASGFKAWLEEYKQEAVGLGISTNVVESALNGVTYDPQVIKLDRNQKVFKQSFEQFSGRMIPPRLKKASAMLKQNADLFARIEQRYGVPKEMVVTLWALETDFGAVRGKLNTIRSLATLAYDCRRSPFFTDQLTGALAIIQRGDLAPSRDARRLGRRARPDAVPADLLREIRGRFRRQRQARPPALHARTCWPPRPIS